MADITRRSFLEHTLYVAAAGLAAARMAEGARVEGPATRPTTRPVGSVAAKDRIGIAILGLHGRGLAHLESYAGDDRVEIVALCDPDVHQFRKAQQMLQERSRPVARTYQDPRKLLEDRDVHVVSIATPNHWHTLAALWAMQSGRDAYVEKPVSHNVSEGRRLEQARLKYRRVCQAGTQSRSTRACQEAVKYIQDGHIGRVLLSRGLCYKRRDSIGHYDDSATPPGLDYNVWLGPAPERPFNKNRFLYNWHWNWDYGNGDIGNQGVHQMDIARWALGKGLPSSVTALGGRFGYKDDGQTPNTQVSVFDYGDSKLLFEVRGLPTSPLMGILVGNIVYGTEGFLAFTGDYGTAVAFDNRGQKVKTFHGASNHFSNFISAVQSRSQEDLNCPILEGHLSSALCHLANVSYRLGKDQPFPVRSQQVMEDMDLAEAFGRFEQHLADSTFSSAPPPETAESEEAPAKSKITPPPREQTSHVGTQLGAREAAAKTRSKRQGADASDERMASSSHKKEQPLKLQEMTYQLGPKLDFDPGSETFGSNRQANQYLTRDYRKPFVVPQQV